MNGGVLTIGELAKVTATQRETIRFYEREKLLPAPARTGGNYRLYGQVHVERLSFIRHCRALDMPLQEIRALLSFYDSPARDCAGANALIDAHIVDLTKRITELNRLRRHLQQLRALCTKDQVVRNCEMLQVLSAPSVQMTAAPARRKKLASRVMRRVS